MMINIFKFFIIYAIIKDNTTAQNTSLLDNGGMSSSVVDQTSQVLEISPTFVYNTGEVVTFVQSILSSSFPTTTTDVFTSVITSFGIQTSDQNVLTSSSLLVDTNIVSSSSATGSEILELQDSTNTTSVSSSSTTGSGILELQDSTDTISVSSSLTTVSGILDDSTDTKSVSSPLTTGSGILEDSTDTTYVGSSSVAGSGTLADSRTTSSLPLGATSSSVPLSGTLVDSSTTSTESLIPATTQEFISASDSLTSILLGTNTTVCISCVQWSSSHTLSAKSDTISKQGTLSASADSIFFASTMNTTIQVAESFGTNYRSDYSLSVNTQVTDMGTSLNNYNSVNTPEWSQVSNYFTSDMLLTQSASYGGDSTLQNTTATSSNVLPSLGPMSTSAIKSESVQYSVSATKTITEDLQNSSRLISISSLNGFTTDQVTLSSNFSLSSSSSDLPGISTRTLIFQTTVLPTSGSTQTVTSGISPTRSSYELGQSTTVSSAADQPSLTTPIRSGVTSALDNMPSSSISPTENSYIADLQRQLNDYKDIENSYKIAVIVLSLILVLLIVLIIVYIYRRRKYYQEKQARLGGAIDEDLLDPQAQMRQKPYFDPQQSANLRISGRISTASLGEDKGGDEPMNLLGSFNRGRKSEDFKEELSEENANYHKDVTL